MVLLTTTITFLSEVLGNSELRLVTFVFFGLMLESCLLVLMVGVAGAFGGNTWVDDITNTCCRGCLLRGCLCLPLECRTGGLRFWPQHTMVIWRW